MGRETVPRCVSEPPKESRTVGTGVPAHSQAVIAPENMIDNPSVCPSLRRERSDGLGLRWMNVEQRAHPIRNRLIRPHRVPILRNGDRFDRKRRIDSANEQCAKQLDLPRVDRRRELQQKPLPMTPPYPETFPFHPLTDREDAVVQEKVLTWPPRQSSDGTSSRPKRKGWRLETGWVWKECWWIIGSDEVLGKGEHDTTRHGLMCPWVTRQAVDVAAALVHFCASQMCRRKTVA